MKKYTFLICFLWANIMFAQPEAATVIETPSIAVQYAETINAKDLKSYLSIIASDDFEGRETATEGQRKAAKYLVSKLQEFDIPPLEMDGVVDGYLQKMPFTKQAWGEVKLNVNGEEFKHLRDFYCFRNSNPTLETTSFEEVTFLGYGIDDEAYSDYAEVDVKGKVIMILAGEPKNKAGDYWISGNSDASAWSSNWRKKLSTAKDKGVKAVLMIDPNAGDNINRYRRWLVEPSIKIGTPDEMEEVDAVNSFYISPELAKVIEGKEGKKIAKARKKIMKKGVSKTYVFKCDLVLQQEKLNEAVFSDNVIAFIEGSDEDLKKEIVAITAHYDHLGKRGDEVYNGADDNGSGTSSLIELAQAYAQAKAEGNGPRRSVMLMWVSGEEKGLLGSAYYVKNPIFPLENTIVNVNVDMVGRVDKEHKDNPNYIYVIGSDRLSSELHEINETMNAKYTRLELDYTYNDENDPNQYYYRSDHYNFAERGIPAIFYFNGTHDDYHRITDTFDKINYDKMATIAKLVFHTSWELANRDKRIVVDKE